MRQVVLDTETTGHSTSLGHRVIEIGCLELIDRELTGRTFHCYINPDRSVDPQAQAVHGLSREFLSDFPKFDAHVEAFLSFVDGSEVLIHNAPFDVGFLDYELGLMRHSKRLADVCEVLDTLVLARRKHPGQKNSLDALCKRYGVNNSHRTYHGALLDAELLAQVYVLMTREQGSLFQERAQETSVETLVVLRDKPGVVWRASDAEVEAHRAFLQAMRQAHGRCIWREDAVDA